MAAGAGQRFLEVEALEAGDDDTIEVQLISGNQQHPIQNFHRHKVVVGIMASITLAGSLGLVMKYVSSPSLTSAKVRNTIAAWCEYENDNECDVPMYCPAGTDHADCGTGVPTPCVTMGTAGVGEGHVCAFPFKYNGQSYSQCTSEGHTQDYCYTQVDSNGDGVSGQWGNCASICDQPVPPPCVTAGSAGAGPGVACVFPFQYKGITYDSCTREGHTKNWCYTEVDGSKWGECSDACQTNVAYCAFENDDECNVPDTCPPGTDTVDCTLPVPTPAPPPNIPPTTLPPPCATDAGVPCVFPFTYQGTSYNECTKIGHTQNWCYTQVDTGGWGNCNINCQLQHVVPCYTENDGICDVPVSCEAGTDVADCTAPQTTGEVAAFNEDLLDFDDTETAPTKCSDCQAPIGKIGPILVVYLTYGSKKPQKTLDQVKTEMFGVNGAGPSWMDILNYASWGQTTLAPGDVTFLEMESDTDPDTLGATPGLRALTTFVTSQSKYKQMDCADAENTGWSYQDPKRPVPCSALTGHCDEAKSVCPVTCGQCTASVKNYKLTMIMQPGSAFQATADTPGKFSRYRGDSIDWRTMAHEVGHNWGISHAGGLAQNQVYEQYQDDALMGFQRTHRTTDFNAVARFNLGWIPNNQVAHFAKQSTLNHRINIRALNEGPKTDGHSAFLVVALACRNCVSIDKHCTGGYIYVSYRVSEPTSNYGVESEDDLFEYGTSRPLTLPNRVHVHFQCDTQRRSEIWNTINVGTEYVVPNSNIAIRPFSFEEAGTTKYVRVGFSGTSGDLTGLESQAAMSRS